MCCAFAGPLAAQDSSAVRPAPVADSVAGDSSAARPTPHPSVGVMAFGAVSAASWTQVIGMPEGWPRTWRGYGYRLGDQVGFAVAEESVRAGLLAVVPWRSMETACVGARAGRAWNARANAALRCGMHSTFVAYTEAGAPRPNVPLLGAVIAASAVSLAWRPERKSARKGQLFVLTRVGIVTGATVLNRGYRAWGRR
jgi:hypothetical protein